jgi:hypothetical protein
VFFGNENIDQYCKFKNSTGSFVQVLQSGTIPKTNSDGEVEIEFSIPSGKFRTGEKQLTVTDNEKNDRGNKYTLMYASGVFASSGLTVKKQTTVGTVRNFEMQHTNDVEQQHKTQNVVWTWDPVAQTFFVNELEYPEGIFLESIDLIFDSKDESIPVSVEIRPTINGFPDINKIHPGGYAIKNPSQINIPGSVTPNWTNSNHITNFKFDYPVYLPPGQHCVMIKSNSKKYTLWCAQMGNTIVGSITNERVTSQPELGVFFRSANASTWEPDGTVDLSFRLKKYYWSTGVSKTLEFIPTASQSQFDDVSYNLYQNTFETNTNKLTYEIINPNLAHADFDSCRVRFAITYKTTSGTDITFTDVKKNTDIVLSSAGQLDKSSDSVMKSVFKTTAIFKPTNRNVSPIFDILQSGITFVRNMIDVAEILDTTTNPPTINSTVSNYELAPSATLKQGTIAGTNPATVRYLSRTIVLDEESTARNIKVGLTAYLPKNSRIFVYVKAGNTTDSTSFDLLPYQELEYMGVPFVSNNIEDYRSMEFELPQDIDLFNRFKIKICIFAADSTSTPKIKDMRAFAIL